MAMKGYIFNPNRPSRGTESLLYSAQRRYSQSSMAKQGDIINPRWPEKGTDSMLNGLTGGHNQPLMALEEGT